MPVTLITGPHQSGKSRRLWELLRAEPTGTAVLVRPEPGLPHDLVRQAHAWFGPGLLPPVLSLAEFVERCGAGAGTPTRPLTVASAAHLLRPWCAGGLRGSPWLAIASCRATAAEIADACARLDDHLVADADLELAIASARAGGEHDLAAAIATLRRARSELAKARPEWATAGERLRALAAEGPAVPWGAVYLDDFTSLTLAELGLLRALAPRRVVATAIDDPRLGRGAPAERLRAAFPEAAIERLERTHARSPHAPAARATLARLLDPDQRIATGVDRYRYRDPSHAGRAIAAWLRRAGVAPGQATVYVRAVDGEALALTDAIASAGVPVRGSFQVPLAATAVGGLLAALGRFSAEASWEALLGACERLGLAGVADGQAPLRLADLRLPWASLPAADALKRLESLVAGDGRRDGWGWSEIDRDRPWLRELFAWLDSWHVRLARPGTFAQRLEGLVEGLALGGPAAQAARRLRELEGMSPAGERELSEILAAARVPVERGGDADPARCLMMVDAVRGRSWPRACAIVHGLEHGRWPRRSPRGVVLGGDRRAALARALGRDVFDEHGRGAGEIAALLAAAARASERLVVGIPCGEREPSPWLATICGQLGWDLEALRAEPDGEIPPGAPLGPADSMGAHEHALWTATARAPSFTFAVPPAWPPRLRPADLNALGDDSFAIVCDRLRLGPLWSDLEALRAGEELHALLAHLAGRPPEAWREELERRLEPWIAAGADAIERAGRRRFAEDVRAVIANEADGLPPGTLIAAEVEVTVPLDVPGLGALALRGRLDRLDRLPLGPVRVVDYKSGYGAAFREAVAEGSEGQLLAYCLGLQAQGEVVEDAYYLGLRDGARPGYHSVITGRARAGQALMVELPERARALGEAIARFARGEACARVDGLCVRRGYAPIARLDEARLDLPVGPSVGEGDDE